MKTLESVTSSIGISQGVSSSVGTSKSLSKSIGESISVGYSQSKSHSVTNSQMYKLVVRTNVENILKLWEKEEVIGIVKVN